MSSKFEYRILQVKIVIEFILNLNLFNKSEIEKKDYKLDQALPIK